MGCKNKHNITTHLFPQFSTNGYNADDAKNIGKITKFITPAKFSNCLIAEDKKHSQ